MQRLLYLVDYLSFWLFRNSSTSDTDEHCIQNSVESTTGQSLRAGRRFRDTTVPHFIFVECSRTRFFMLFRELDVLCGW